MIDLVLTLDYEIFGNGAGDVRRDMIEPTRRLLSLCDRYGGKVSVMLEVGAYWAMREAEQAGQLRLHHAPSGEIEKQVQYAARCGHDVQLHLHPWWIGATFRDGTWQLRPEYRRITDLPNGIGFPDDPFSVVGVLSQGRQTLETMVRPVCPTYECLVYRAAEFWGQPSGDLICGLKKAGLVADSSVVKGLHETHPVPTDYRHAPSAGGYWWTSGDDISQAGPAGEHIIEFPVYSRLRLYLHNFTWTKLRATLKRRSMERANTHGHGMMEARKSTESFGQILRKLGTRQPLKYDFCKLSADDMIRGLKRAMRDDKTGGDGVGTPVVMLGHSKDFWNDRNLEAFLRFVKGECEGRVRFSTLAEVTKRIMNKELSSQQSSRQVEIAVSSPLSALGCQPEENNG